MNEMNIIIPVLVLSVMGIAFGVALAYASKVFAVKVDERVQQVRDLLPGANCAACGYTGCDAYAAAVVSGETQPNLCTVGGQETAGKIAAIMGVEAGTMEKRVARVRCAGVNGKCAQKYDYDGIMDCTAASLVHDGPSACGYGCLGLGNCVKECAFGAVYIADGIASIIESRCTACGKCVSACPKRLIELVPVNTAYTVLCANNDRGAVTRKNCGVGCIGCLRCTKVCQIQAITVKNNLAYIDASKCRQCGECVKVCPQRAINYFECELTKNVG